MKERLSTRKTLFQKIFLTVILFIVLSLPTPLGLLDLILIRSDYSIVIILQRIIHFSSLFYLINKFLQDNFFLEFDGDYLFLNDRGLETTIPLSKIYYLELKPKYVEFDKASYKFGLRYFDEFDVPTEVEFYAYTGKRLNRFIELVTTKNSEFELKKWTLFG